MKRVHSSAKLIPWFYFFFQIFCTFKFSCNHRLRTPNEAFFHWNPELLGLGSQIRQINSGPFWVFSAELSAPILVQWVPCWCFFIIQPLVLQKKYAFIIYIHIPNIYLGFKFGSQRIRDLAIVCPYNLRKKSTLH